VAVRASRAVRPRFGGSDDAARARFLLARAVAAAPRGAAAAALFVDYTRVAPNGVFAEEAAGRLLELARARGDARAAREAARSYLERFPRGASADVARAQLLP
jgi:hypothetical protein